MKSVNVRFWTYANSGWVKLTLKPESTLWHETVSYDGGWSHSNSQMWSHINDGVFLHERHCDGRHRHDTEFEANGLIECHGFTVLDLTRISQKMWVTNNAN